MKKKTLSKLTDKKIILKQKGDGNFCKNNFLLSTENSKGYWYPRLDTVKLSIPINNNDYHKALLRVKHIMNEKDKYPGLVYIDLYTSKYTLPKTVLHSKRLSL